MIDLHCDTLSRITREKENLWENKGQWDISRAQLAGTSLQVLALFAVPDETDLVWAKINQQIKYFGQQLEQEKVQQNTFFIQKSEDLQTCLEQQKMGFLLHLEGGEALGKNLDRLEVLYEQGVRSLGLTWNYRNALADGALEYSDDRGISDLGRRLIHDLNERKILLDLAHASPKTFFQALEITQRPAYVSHANISHLCPHPRNLSDEQIKAIAEQNGVIGLTYYREFLSTQEANQESLLNHMVYTAELVGCEALALGSDFDGAQDMIFSDVSDAVFLRENMRRRGFYPEEIEKILEKNARNYLKQYL